MLFLFSPHFFIAPLFQSSFPSHSTICLLDKVRAQESLRKKERRRRKSGLGQRTKTYKEKGERRELYGFCINDYCLILISLLGARLALSRGLYCLNCPHTIYFFQLKDPRIHTGYTQRNTHYLSFSHKKNPYPFTYSQTHISIKQKNLSISNPSPAALLRRLR